MALYVAEDAEVLCLCGRNQQLRERVSERFAGDPRVRVLGFTNRMGEVLAASNVLIHSSVGLTVLEAIIRGCPVISYGFGYGHVRVSNHALERFKLAQVARSVTELGPAIERALAERLEPDELVCERPSTAALILNSTRRVQPLPPGVSHGARRHACDRRRPPPSVLRPSFERRLRRWSPTSAAPAPPPPANDQGSQVGVMSMRPPSSQAPTPRAKDSGATASRHVRAPKASAAGGAS